MIAHTQTIFDAFKSSLSVEDAEAAIIALQAYVASKSE